MSDFTGERLIPGEVDADLWNEHISRYFFAASLCKKNENVLDAGCGTGYGSSFLNRRSGARVLGIDVSPDAIAHAMREYAASGAQFAIGLCESLPVQDDSIRLITAFEVIEHLAGWREFLVECRRVLTDDGLLLVSTPNRAVYAESRGDAGPNPFHVHEFDFDEFSRELAKVFPFVRVFGQNHTGTITLSALGEAAMAAERESLRVAPDSAGYLLAVCGRAELPPIPNLVFVPEAANTLLERDRHIHLLKQEFAETIAQRDRHIRLLTEDTARQNREFTNLLERHRALTEELECSNRWAESLQGNLNSAGERIGLLQTELERSNRWAERIDSELKDSGLRIAQLQLELAKRNAWADKLDGLLRAANARILELQGEVETRNQWAASLMLESEQRIARVVALQQELEERTQWAQAVDGERAAAMAQLAETMLRLEAATAKLNSFEESRWVKLGKTIHLGPLAQ